MADVSLFLHPRKPNETPVEDPATQVSEMDNSDATTMHSPLVERALRLAADAHRSQFRKGTNIPYITHPCAVAMILVRAGFTDDELLAAALLHDVVEDTGVSMEELKSQFPPRVCELVAELSEEKTDSAGRARPWRVRKAEHLEHLRRGSRDALALALADKLHNLSTMHIDLETDPNIWCRFNSSPQDLLGYYRSVAELASSYANDEAIQRLAGEVDRLIVAIQGRL